MSSGRARNLHTMLGIVALSAAMLHGATASAAAAHLVLPDRSGKVWDLTELTGKVVVVNFWATWCSPCREEMPVLARLHREYREKGVVFLGPSVDEASSHDQIDRAVEEARVDFPILLGADTTDMTRLGVGTALPATAVVDQQGRVAFRLVGLVSEDDLRARLDWLLADRDRDRPDSMQNDMPRMARQDGHADHDDHAHGGDGDHHDEEPHQHGVVALEGASLVPS